MDRFDEFWEAYPRRDKTPRITGRKKAREKLLKIVGDGEAAWDEIITGTRLYAQCDNVASGYVCIPMTWINQARWEDEYEPVKKHFTERPMGSWTENEWREALGDVNNGYRQSEAKNNWNVARYGPKPPHSESKLPAVIQDEYRIWWPDLRVVEM